MPSEARVRVRALGKHYLRRGVGSLRDLFKASTPTPQWALENINLTVTPKEILGVIGPNGAGKSTLVRILARMTRPSRGEAKVWGRTVTFFEVGTGFHPDFTVRENIRLGGALLGMSKREIAGAMEQVLEFSGLSLRDEALLKTLSRGMQQRLSLAVALHAPGDLFLVDEAFETIDQEFERKAIRRIQDMAKQGKTFVFISHQKELLRRVATRLIWLDGGQIRKDGLPEDVLNHYA